jgi:hypothetical protein
MSARLASFLESRFWLFNIGSLLGKNRVSVYQWFTTGNIKSVLGYRFVDIVIGPIIRGSPSLFADETREERDLVRLLSPGED